MLPARLFLPLVGFCLGSFANVFAFRFPKHESVVWTPSRCPCCRRPIAWYYNIPVLGWIFAGGRCAVCRTSIPAHYPLVEAVFGLVAILPFAYLDGGLAGFYYWFFFCAMALIAWVDWNTLRVYDIFTFPLGFAGLFASILFPAFYHGKADSVIGGAVLLVVMALAAALGRAVFKREALGAGDIKLMAAAGGFLGWRHGLAAVVLGYFLGGLVAPLALLKGSKLKDPLPFAPFLAAASLACCMDLLSQGSLVRKLNLESWFLF